MRRVRDWVRFVAIGLLMAAITFGAATAVVIS